MHTYVNSKWLAGISQSTEHSLKSVLVSSSKGSSRKGTRKDAAAGEQF